MVTLKIECTCGQKYAFDTEPVNGRMPSAVACPVCGADGTEASNAALAQSFPQQAAPVAAPMPVAVPAMAAASAPAAGAPIRIAAAAPAQGGLRIGGSSGGGGLRLSGGASHSPPPAAGQPESAPPPAAAPAAPRRPVGRLPGQMDPQQARHEARAKILWGDPPEQVTSWLCVQGFSRPEAQALVNELSNERAKTVRSGGIRNIGTGIVLLCVPIGVVLYTVVYLQVIQSTLLGLSAMAGLFGIYLIIKGIIKVVAPKSLTGDAME
jgi:hypothetical protein